MFLVKSYCDIIWLFFRFIEKVNYETNKST